MKALKDYLEEIKMSDEVTTDEIKELEEELKQLENKDTSYGSPKSPEKDSQFKFFRDILKIKTLQG